jgi:hypothetical protein
MGMQAVKGGTLGAKMTLQRTQVVFPSKASHSKAIQSDQKRSLLICRPSYLRRVFQIRSVCLVRNRLACKFSGNRTQDEGTAQKFMCSAVRTASDIASRLCCTHQVRFTVRKETAGPCCFSRNK